MIFSIKQNKNSFLSFDGDKFFSSTSLGDFTDSFSESSININKFSHVIDEPFLFNNNKLSAHLKSFSESHIDVSLFELYQLLEDSLFDSLMKEKLKCMFSWYETHKETDVFEKAQKYFQEYGNKQYFVLNEIQKSKIFLDNERRFIRVKYNDTRTGRLSCDGEINLFTLKNEKRSLIIAPKDYVLVKFDFIACQVRLFFYLLGKKDFYECIDPYEKIADILKCSRELAKSCSVKMIFGSSKNALLKTISVGQYKKLQEIFDKKIPLDESSGFLFNFFGRPVKISSHNQNVLINNVLQSMERDVLLNATYNVNKLIKDQKTSANIYFTFHDALCIIIQKRELPRLDEIKEKFETSWSYCKMYSKEKIGQNFLEVS